MADQNSPNAILHGRVGQIGTASEFGRSWCQAVPVPGRPGRGGGGRCLAARPLRVCVRHRSRDQLTWSQRPAGAGPSVKYRLQLRTGVLRGGPPGPLRGGPVTPGS